MKQNADLKQDILKAINSFKTNSIFDAGINLFNTLGYDTSLQAPLDNKTYNEFKELYIDSSPNKERFNEEKAAVADWKAIDILFQLTDDSFTGQGRLFKSTLNPYEKQSYLCFAVELSGTEYTKTQIANITREINKLFIIPILVIYKYGEFITLAVINRRMNKKDTNRDVLEKVTLIKDIVVEKPHRAHIEILADMSFTSLNAAYSIHNFETLHKAWSEVLDTQTLNKRFYTELSNWYFWAIKTVVYPGYEMEADKEGLFKKEEKIREHNAKNLIRLISRILFIWFIKEKDLIPEELFDERTIREIIDKFNPEFNTTEKSDNPEAASIYYKAILQNLFFASLNAEQGKRAFRIDGQNQNATSLMRYKRYHKNPDAFVNLIESKVPFMNGGLFECLDHQSDTEKGRQGGAIIIYEDGFSDRKDNVLFVPDYIFFGKNIKADLSSEYDDKKKKDVIVNGLINILSSYKFTIAENTPIEEDIALDPELLGRVFENLLASYNPETKTNARKQTGSFYTPRPIVEYMVDESLKAYLKSKMSEVSDIDKKISDLIAYNEKKPEFTEQEKDKILHYLDSAKILDPACGSGAFPMGILQKMVYVIHKLDPQNDNWKQIQIQKISGDVYLSSEEKNKLQKDILTVFDDNELDYARKLYLIENCIHGIDIQPIATQISRLRFFISLIVDQKVDRTKTNFGVRSLPNLENRFVTANSLIKLEKSVYLKSKQLDKLMKELQEIRHNLFRAKTPKYKSELRQTDKKTREELKEELLILGFGRANAGIFASWNPYDQNATSSFFDAEWMFGIKDGFDIVIGNPPYVQLQNDHGKLGKFYQPFGYKTFASTGDIYCLFYEQGYNLLRQGGHLCYITSNKWMRAGYGEKLRGFFSKEVNPIILIDFAGVKVFDSATVDTNILIFKKGRNEGRTKSCIATSLTKDGLSNLSDFVQQKSNFQKFDNLNPWVILSPIEQSIKSKIEKIGTPLSNWNINIYRGVLTGFNDAFIISGEKKQEILSNCKSSEERKRTDELIRPILRGRDIKRYSYNWADFWLIYIPWHFPLHQDPTIQGASKKAEEEFKKQYPSVYTHLLSYKKELSARNKAETGIRYEWYAMQRWGANYWEEFNKPKIVWKRVGSIIRFSFDTNKCMTLDSTCFAVGEHIKYLVAILNSKFGNYLLQDAPKTGTGDLLISVQAVEPLMIPIPNKLFEDTINKLLDKILTGDKEAESEINRRVYNLYGLSDEEIDFIQQN